MLKLLPLFTSHYLNFHIQKTLKYFLHFYNHSLSLSLSLSFTRLCGNSNITLVKCWFLQIRFSHSLHFSFDIVTFSPFDYSFPTFLPVKYRAYNLFSLPNYIIHPYSSTKLLFLHFSSYSDSVAEYIEESSRLDWVSSTIFPTYYLVIGCLDLRVRAIFHLFSSDLYPHRPWHIFLHHLWFPLRSCIARSLYKLLINLIKYL